MNAKSRIVPAGRILGIALTGAAAISARSALAIGPKPGWAWKGLVHDDPIGSIADKMDDVVIDLKDVKTDAPVQTKEKAVVADLDQVIAQLTQQCKGSGGGNPNPSKPMANSTLAKGPGGSGPMHDAKEGTRLWGQLPPKLREQILQSQTEGFPPGYEAVLASYYARLAQGQVPDASDPSVAPTTRPAAH
jgi:hypothetical protein